MTLLIKIESEPLPLNRLYPSSKSGRRFLSAEGKAFKLMVRYASIKAYNEQGFIFDPDSQYISTEVFYYTPKLITAEGKINTKKSDTSNNFKAIEDSIFETLGINDCYNLNINAVVNYSKEPLVVVILRTHLISSLIDTSKI